MSVQVHAPLGSEISREALHGSLMIKSLLLGGAREMGRVCGVMTTRGLPPLPRRCLSGDSLISLVSDVCFP